MKAKIIIKNYPEEARGLIEIWNKHLDPINNGLDFITFVNKRPRNPKSENRRIAGLSAKAISYLNDDRELIKMSVENFIYLMAKSGVGMEITEVQDE